MFHGSWVLNNNERKTMFKIVSKDNKFNDLSFKSRQQAFEFIYEKVGFHGWFIENKYHIEKATTKGKQ